MSGFSVNTASVQLQTNTIKSAKSTNNLVFIISFFVNFERQLRKAPSQSAPNILVFEIMGQDVTLKKIGAKYRVRTFFFYSGKEEATR